MKLQEGVWFPQRFIFCLHLQLSASISTQPSCLPPQGCETSPWSKKKIQSYGGRGNRARVAGACPFPFDNPVFQFSQFPWLPRPMHTQICLRVGSHDGTSCKAKPAPLKQGQVWELPCSSLSPEQLIQVGALQERNPTRGVPFCMSQAVLSSELHLWQKAEWD